MKLSEKISRHTPTRPFYTFEFFPPRTDQGFENLLSRISRLSELDPIAISVTWGAGGSTKDRSLELAGITQNEYCMETVLHLTCTNMERGMVDDALRDAKSRGIQNILALRGDPPRGQESWIPTDPRFTHGVDLVSYIRSLPEYSSYFCVGVAAYPDEHPDHVNDEEAELEYLKMKVDAGADFIMTQFFYDVDNFLRWVEKVRQKGISIPIIPGIMPIQTYSTFRRLVKLCGIRIPDSLTSALDPIKHDDQKVKDFGVDLAIDMIRRIITSNSIRGVNFCTLNLEKSVQLVLEGLSLAGDKSRYPPNKLITEISGAIFDPNQSKIELVTTPSTAANEATSGLNGIPVGEAEMGRGELNSPATWDEFPNGRFGDFKSPAFGDQAPWGNLGLSRSDVPPDWGSPKTFDDLTQVFLRHLHSEISTTPFSPGPLSPESQMILNHLEKLTQRGWWTVGSQPAINGARSSDETVGWGPRGGYVFQKCFVEFFAEKNDVQRIATQVNQHGKGWVHYFAANIQGELRTNVPEEGRNAVTWGVFPGQEIIQTTIIEQESFLSWKDEAFSIWQDWASFYSPVSEERRVLERVRSERWLVSIVHHNYRDADALWRFLLDEFEEQAL